MKLLENRYLLIALALGYLFLTTPIQTKAQLNKPDTINTGRERLLMDFGWRFSWTPYRNRV